MELPSLARLSLRHTQATGVETKEPNRIDKFLADEDTNDDIKNRVLQEWLFNYLLEAIFNDAGKPLWELGCAKIMEACSPVKTALERLSRQSLQLCLDNGPWDRIRSMMNQRGLDVLNPGPLLQQNLPGPTYWDAVAERNRVAAPGGSFRDTLLRLCMAYDRERRASKEQEVDGRPIGSLNYWTFVLRRTAFSFYATSAWLVDDTDYMLWLLSTSSEVTYGDATAVLVDSAKAYMFSRVLSPRLRNSPSFKKEAVRHCAVIITNIAPEQRSLELFEAAVSSRHNHRVVEALRDMLRQDGMRRPDEYTQEAWNVVRLSMLNGVGYSAAREFTNEEWTHFKNDRDVMLKFAKELTTDFVNFSESYPFSEDLEFLKDALRISPRFMTTLILYREEPPAKRVLDVLQGDDEALGIAIGKNPSLMRYGSPSRQAMLELMSSKMREAWKDSDDPYD